MTTDQLPLLLSVAQAADMLGVSERHVRYLIQSGEFPVPGVHRFGSRLKISRVQLERWAAGELPDSTPAAATEVAS